MGEPLAHWECAGYVVTHSQLVHGRQPHEDSHFHHAPAYCGYWDPWRIAKSDLDGSALQSLQHILLLREAMH